MRSTEKKEYVLSLGDAPASEVIAKAKEEKGWKFSPKYVYGVRSRQNRGHHATKVSSNGHSHATAVSSDFFSGVFERIQAKKDRIEQLEKKARELVEELSTI